MLNGLRNQSLFKILLMNWVGLVLQSMVPFVQTIITSKLSDVLMGSILTLDPGNWCCKKYCYDYDSATYLVVQYGLFQCVSINTLDSWTWHCQFVIKYRISNALCRPWTPIAALTPVPFAAGLRQGSSIFGKRSCAWVIPSNRMGSSCPFPWFLSGVFVYLLYVDVSLFFFLPPLVFFFLKCVLAVSQDNT